jgi:hypothetical protein
VCWWGWGWVDRDGVVWVRNGQIVMVNKRFKEGNRI